MATIKCTVQRSDWYEIYIEYAVSQNPVTAVSTISHALKLKQLTDSWDFWGQFPITYKIGSDSFSHEGIIDIDDKGNKGYTITIKSGTTTIQHNTSTGVGSFWAECSGSCNASGYGPGTVSLSGRNVALTTIDRAAPTISLATSSVTASSVIITATSNATVDIWDYSLDDGENWTRMSTTAGTTASKTITGLSPNTTYKIKVRGRRQYNQVYGTSSAKSITTLGNSLLNSVNTFTVDVASPVLTMNWTVYAAYTHTLVIKDGTTTVLTITGITCSTGRNNKTITLTAEQRTTILRYMSTIPSFNATYELTTYSGNTKIGNTVSKTGYISTSSEVSAPIFTDFTHRDRGDRGTVDITGNDQIYIKNSSVLELTITAATARNEAYITGYAVIIGSNKRFTENLQYPVGYIEDSGEVTIQVEAVDSRGYMTPVSKVVTVIDYEKVSITDYTIRRKNEVEATVQLAFSGDIAPITIDGEAQNGVVSAKFRYAPNGGSWSGWNNLTVAETTRNFEYATLALSNSSGVLEFNPNSQYTIDIKITDHLSSDTMTIILNKGTPLVAFRAKKVGINTPDPQDALDVREGNIRMNGYVIQGFVAELGNTEDLHDLTHNGVWTQHLNANASTDRHYPVAKAGYLEVFENPQGYVLQRYTTFDCSGIYICYRYNDEWSAWRSVNIS